MENLHGYSGLVSRTSPPATPALAWREGAKPGSNSFSWIPVLTNSKRCAQKSVTPGKPAPFVITLLLALTCCGKHGPMDRIEDLSSQRQEQTGSLASLAGKEEGMVFTLKGSELTSSFSQTKAQKNLYQNTLKAMQGYPYSVDPTGKTVYTDWFEDDQKRPTKITVLLTDKDVVVNAFTKHKGQAVSDRKKSMALEMQIKNG